MGGAASVEIDKSKEALDDLDRLVHKQQHLIKVAFAQADAGSATKPRVTSEAEVAARNIPVGSCVRVWKQDPSVSHVGIRRVHLPHDIANGPKDDLIEVVMEINAKNKEHKVSQLAQKDTDGDFLVDFDKDPFTFDLVNAYSISRLVVDMYVRDLRIDWKWHWDRNLAAGAPKTPLRIIAHAGEKPNAVYHRGKKCLKFYYYTDGGNTTYLCRSFDIVAHETGHAVLDALKPKLYSVHKGQSGALHEAFGDLTAIFAVLDQMDMCEEIIAATKGDLRKAGNLTAIGEQFGKALSGESPAERKEEEGEDDEHVEVSGMRNANNNLCGDEVGDNCHELSNVFTGYIFDVLVAMFQWERNPRLVADAETLHRVARMLRRIFLLALFNVGEVPDFVDISRAMEGAAQAVAAEDPGDVKQYIRFISQFRQARMLAEAGKPKREEKIDLGDW